MEKASLQAISKNPVYTTFKSFIKLKMICTNVQTSQGHDSNTTNTEKYTLSLYKNIFVATYFDTHTGFPLDDTKRSDHIIHKLSAYFTKKVVSVLTGGVSTTLVLMSSSGIN